MVSTVTPRRELPAPQAVQEPLAGTPVVEMAEALTEAPVPISVPGL